MPAEISILLGESDRGLRAPSPQQAHGMICALIAETDEGHSGGGKPWSMRPVELGDGGIRLGFSWLDDDNRPSVLRDGLPESVRLGPAWHPVVRASGREVDWGTIRSRICSEVTLRFKSPMWFSRNGRLYPVPDPVLVYRRLAERWASFADTPLPTAETDALLASVEIRDMAGETFAYNIGKGTKTGFVGTATFTVGRRSEAASVLGALSSFAEVAGVGALTTYGAGTVEILESRPPRSARSLSG